MLDDPIARQIISKARQKNVAAECRGSSDFDHLFADFFADFDFRGQTVLDLGPGQYDFARRIRDAGGTAENIDKDSAVVELGNYLGFRVYEGDLRRLNVAELSGRYDGLFCKFSINAFWFDDCDSVAAHIDELNELMKPDAWGWIAPWNGVPKIAPPEEAQRAMLAAQVEAFEAHGWTTCFLTPSDAGYYGISGRVANHLIFVKGIAIPAKLRRRQRVA